MRYLLRILANFARGMASKGGLDSPQLGGVTLYPPGFGVPWALSSPERRGMRYLPGDVSLGSPESRGDAVSPRGVGPVCRG